MWASGLPAVNTLLSLSPAPGQFPALQVTSAPATDLVSRITRKTAVRGESEPAVKNFWSLLPPKAQAPAWVPEPAPCPPGTESSRSLSLCIIPIARKGLGFFFPAFSEKSSLQNFRWSLSLPQQSSPKSNFPPTCCSLYLCPQKPHLSSGLVTPWDTSHRPWGN